MMKLLKVFRAFGKTSSALFLYVAGGIDEMEARRRVSAARVSIGREPLL
jgi:hypothetical protein